MDDLISIVVPVYQVEKYLNRCIESLVKQSYSNIEIILVDDGSNDGSGEICETFAKKDSRIKVIHQKNAGSSAARNAGINASHGGYIGFVDSDDWVTNDMYEYMHKIMKENSADIVDIECQFAYSYPTEVKFLKERIEVLENDSILLNYLYKGLNAQKSAPFSACRKLYSRELFDTFTFPVGKVNEDIIANYKILKKCQRIVISNQIKYFYFQNRNSISSGILKKRDLDLLSVCKEMCDLSELEKNQKINELARMKLVRSYFSILARIATSGCDHDIKDQEGLVEDLTDKLRKNYFLLLKSPMPFNRKVFAGLVCININCIKFLAIAYKKLYVCRNKA